MIKKSITCLASLGQCLIMSCRASSHVCIDYTKKQKKNPKKPKTKQDKNETTFRLFCSATKTNSVLTYMNA